MAKGFCGSAVPRFLKLAVEWPNKSDVRRRGLVCNWRPSTEGLSESRADLSDVRCAAGARRAFDIVSKGVPQACYAKSF